MARVPDADGFVDVLRSHDLAQHRCSPEDSTVNLDQQRVQGGHVLPVELSMREAGFDSVLVQIQHEHRTIALALRDPPDGVDLRGNWLTLAAQAYHLGWTELAQAAFDQAQAGIAKTEAIISQKLVRAPFDGELGVRHVEVGQFLTAGTQIVSLTDLSVLYANFTVTEKDSAQLKVGQVVRIGVDAYPGRTFDGKITTIEPQIATDTRNIRVQATLQNPDKILKPGMIIMAEPNPITADGLFGIFLGHTLIVTKDGKAVIRHSGHFTLDRDPKPGDENRVCLPHPELFGVLRKHMPAKVTLADTAASEHMTAIMVHLLFDTPEMIEQADPRLAGMYAWHAMEEMEHKAVAFDVMQQVAKVGYFKRCAAMTHALYKVVYDSMRLTNLLLKGDGFSFGQRMVMCVKGAWWLYGPGGLFARNTLKLMQYYKPGFHPWDAGAPSEFQTWMRVMQQSGDPIAASDALQPRA